ncbi:hypothetical protein [Lysinibacillus xylanilyticus]|uniref:hypothetical protein n=1 Tax=Lysinibacillus xylanilyticus TaxID=582475 RepID=UPI00381C9852
MCESVVLTQRQMFFVRKRSANAAQQQMFFARKRSGSGTDAGQLAVIAWMR